MTWRKPKRKTAFVSAVTGMVMQTRDKSSPTTTSFAPPHRRHLHLHLRRHLHPSPFRFLFLFVVSIAFIIIFVVFLLIFFCLSPFLFSLPLSSRCCRDSVDVRVARAEHAGMWEVALLPFHSALSFCCIGCALITPRHSISPYHTISYQSLTLISVLLLLFSCKGSRNIDKTNPQLHIRFVPRATIHWDRP